MSADKLPEDALPERVAHALQLYGHSNVAVGKALARHDAANESLSRQSVAKYGGWARMAILAALRERERETIERCAQVCDNAADYLMNFASATETRVAYRVAAERIRALLPPEEKTTPCE